MVCQFMLAGTNSGSGKTTFTIGIMAALHKRGIEVQGFKAGPDYIDPMFHAKVTDRASYNLDTWMLDSEYLKYVYSKAAKDSDVSVIEGVMGLFDGHGVDSNEGSSSDLSEKLNLPVILVVDGRGKSRSLAAEINGFKHFEKNTRIAGVLINRLSSEMHYNYMKEIVENYTGLKCYGYLKKDDNFGLKERHLGLVPAEEDSELECKVQLLIDRIESSVDLDAIIEDFNKPLLEVIEPEAINQIKGIAKGKTIAVAKDEAFNFYYESNFDLLKHTGVNIKFFSPLNDKILPENIDGIYLGGGYPEIFAKELEQNISMRNSVEKAFKEGVFGYAECGGLMYLTKSITNSKGEKFDMVGFFNRDSFMTDKLQNFGYAEVNMKNGLVIKAHEFHHSKIEPSLDESSFYDMKKYRKNKIFKTWNEGFVKENVLASYAHLHFGSNLNVLKWLLEKL
ncbi:MAG: cobyrinate a,c-diamide synthase [Tissierellales bacterium]|nr:cobyrinate a,c-diamide synthase [Tissierellales bacterium]